MASLIGAGGKTSLMFRLARELASAGKRVLTTTTTRIYRPRAEQCRTVFCSHSPAELLRAGRLLAGCTRHCTLVGGYLQEEGKLEGIEPQVVDELWGAGIFDWVLVEADGAKGRPLKAHAEHEPVLPETSTDVIAVLGLDGLGRALDESVAHRPETFSRVTGLAPGARVTAEALARVLTSERGLFRSAPAGSSKAVYLNQAEGRRQQDAAELLRDLEASGLFDRIAAGSLQSCEIRSCVGGGETFSCSTVRGRC